MAATPLVTKKKTNVANIDEDKLQHFLHDITSEWKKASVVASIVTDLISCEASLYFYDSPEVATNTQFRYFPFRPADYS